MFETKLRESREKMNLSQQEMADILEISVSTYNKFENGRQLPRIDVFKRICTALKVSSDWLLGIEKEDRVKIETKGEMLKILIALVDCGFYVSHFNTCNGFLDDGIPWESYKELISVLIVDSETFSNVSEEIEIENLGLYSKLSTYRNLKDYCKAGDIDQETLDNFYALAVSDDTPITNKLEKNIGDETMDILKNRQDYSKNLPFDL